MLTGPVTILCWSFPREDITREVIAKQIALALRDGVEDLEKAGIGIHPDRQASATRRPTAASIRLGGVPLNWAVDAFKLNAVVA